MPQTPERLLMQNQIMSYNGAAASSESAIGTSAIARAEPIAWNPSRVTFTAPAWTSYGELAL